VYTCLLVFASSCSSFCIRAATAKTGFVGGRQEEEIEEDEAGGPTRKKNRKSPVSTDVVLARSTRSDARWSCLVYPNYLLSRQVRRVHRWITFYSFFPRGGRERLMTYCASKRRRNASRDVVFIDVAEINADFAEKQHGVRRIVSAYYYDELLRAKIHLLHSTYFMEAFMKNTQYCFSLLFLRYYARISFAIVKNCDFIKKNCYISLCIHNHI